MKEVCFKRISQFWFRLANICSWEKRERERKKNGAIDIAMVSNNTSVAIRLMVLYSRLKRIAAASYGKDFSKSWGSNLCDKPIGFHGISLFVIVVRAILVRCRWCLSCSCFFGRYFGLSRISWYHHCYYCYYVMRLGTISLLQIWSCVIHYWATRGRMCTV